MENNPAININNSNILVYTGQPTFLVRHSISDEELNLLTEKTKDFVSEIMWVAMGGTVGALPSTISWFRSGKDAGAGDQFIWTVFVFFACLSVSTVTGIIHYQRCKRTTKLEEQIRERTRVAMSGVSPT